MKCLSVRFLHLLVIVLALISVGCRTATDSKPAKYEPRPVPPRLPTTIKIGKFECENQVTAQATRNVFIETLSRNRSLKIVQEGEAEITVEGTITQAHGGSSGGNLAGGTDWIAGKSQAVVGEFVSGITALAYRKGEILTSASWGQVLSKGAKLLPPEYVAREAAGRLENAIAEKISRAKYGDIVWCGLDYSKVKMFSGTEFNQPNQIFPAELNAWNELFSRELFPKIERIAITAESDLAAVTFNNQKVGQSQVEMIDGTYEKMVIPSHITESEIAELIQSYKLQNRTGTGLVFVMDRLVKAQAIGCYYVVLFDIASRKTIYCERYCENASGSGFRNYWFTPIKAGVDRLRRQ